MLKRIRQLKISLAAKCQLLFGAAVVLIIGAALFVPWQRMEQLMQQLNERSAAQVARTAVMEHIATSEKLMTVPRLPGPVTVPTTQPISLEGEEFLPPRMIGISRTPGSMTLFERKAVRQFIDDPESAFFARDYDRRSGYGYRYAEPLFLKEDCLRCHLPPAGISPMLNGADSSQANLPTTRPGAYIGIVSVDIPSQIETNQLLLNRVFFLAAGLLAGTLALLVFSTIILRLILQPVRVLQETAEKVSEGDLNIRSDISTGDEFQQLSETFNTMLANLQAGEDQLRAVNKSLDLKLGQLAETNVSLYESNRLKSEFLANVSHELRTPLNSILGFADLLKDAGSVSADAKTVRYVQNILRSGQNLLDLINDLLDLAKIEAGRMEVRSEPISLKDVFEGLTIMLKPLTEPKNLIVNATVAPDFPIIHTDPAKLQQVLYNFLSNAIKFSPVGGKIELMGTREGSEAVRISVTDQGPGIDPSKQAVIFEKFRQIDGSVTREHSGTGLGLAISRELMTLINGEIGVRSASGEGATFWITLPLKIQAGTHDVRANMVLS